MKKISLKKLISLFLCLLFMAASSVSAFAADGEAASEYSLNVVFRHEENAISGAKFRAYKAADLNDDGSYTLSGSFTAYSVSLDRLDSEGLSALASTLASYAVRDKLAPDFEGVTDDNGRVTFANVPKGLYLVAGDPVIVDKVRYFPQPFMAAVPCRDESGQLVNDVVAEPKYDMDTDLTTPVERKVIKLWDDDDGDVRPAQITVELLKDGTVYDTVVLSAENNWRHTWTDLDAGSMWLLVEQSVPSGYTVTVVQDCVTFIVTNTHHKPQEITTTEPSTEPTTASGGSEPTTLPFGTTTPQGSSPAPTPTGPYDSHYPTSPSAPFNPDTDVTKPPQLPLTGQLWWPVPVMLSVGLLLFVLGFVGRKRGGNA